jgi:predicted nucleic acid-binding protein
VIVVDTTVWIDFLEARETPFDFHLKELIERGSPIALTDVIYCEILQGILPENKFRRIRNVLLAYLILQVSDATGFCGYNRKPPIEEAIKKLCSQLA